MADRRDMLDRFVAGTRWGNAVRTPLAGDASARRYERCTLPQTGETCVLMDAPPEMGESVLPFVRIARHLTAAGFSAPAIISEDISNGFLLIEDFGDSVFARMIGADATCETPLYESAVDVLVGLNGAPILDGLISFTPALMAEQAGLIFQTYARDERLVAGFRAALETVLTQHLPARQVLILRDYHAENLIWLPDQSGNRRVGLLDFQDAMAGPVGYDLISLVHDARRDVSVDLADRMVARFTNAFGIDTGAFAAIRAVLCAQRNLRILAVFARLARQQGKTGYVDLIPRVWNHLQSAMAHPALKPLEPFVASLSPPTARFLTDLRTSCAQTCP